MNMIDRLKIESKGCSTYEVRREEYKSNKNGINFRVSPTPFKLNRNQKEELENIGKAICDYMDSCIELYNINENVHEILDRGKPSQYRDARNVKYLFLRPDLILTDKGFSICEIETSPFGLGLAEILNRAYGNEGFDTIVYQNQLRNYDQPKIGQRGTIPYSEKVKACSGQLDFMAKEVFSGDGKKWNSQKITDSNIANQEIYRAFYLSEQFVDPNVAKLLQASHIYLPSSTP